MAKMSKLRKWIIYRKWCKDRATLEEFRAAGGLPEMLRMAGIKPCPPEEAARHIYRPGPMGFSIWTK